MRKVKIVFFIDVLKKDFDGVANTSRQIIFRLPRDKFDIILITPQPPDDPDFPFKVYQCPYFDLPGYKEYRFALPGRMKGLTKLLDDFAPDIVHWSTPSALGWYAVRYATRRNISVVSIYHTHFTAYVEGFLKFVPWLDRISLPIARKFLGLYRRCNLVLAPTVSMHRYLEQLGVEKAKLATWGRGIDTGAFNPGFKSNKVIRALHEGGEKNILFVSRLVRYKQTDVLIEFYKHMLPGWKLVVTGTGPDEGRMKRLMPNAIFTGKLIGDRLSKIYASADVFLFPSITETFGNVVLEAMASGLPVVAARAGGPSDIIQDGVTGFLVEPKNSQQLHDRVSTLLADPVLHRTIAENALKFAQQQDWDVLCEEITNYYLKLAGKKS